MPRQTCLISSEYAWGTVHGNSPSVQQSREQAPNPSSLRRGETGPGLSLSSSNLAQGGEKSKRHGHRCQEVGSRKALTMLRANLAGFTVSPCCPSSEPGQPHVGQRDFLSGAAAAGAVLQGHLAGRAVTQSLTHPEDAMISPGPNTTTPGHRNCMALYCPETREGGGEGRFRQAAWAAGPLTLGPGTQFAARMAWPVCPLLSRRREP